PPTFLGARRAHQFVSTFQWFARSRYKPATARDPVSCATKFRIFLADVALLLSPRRGPRRLRLLQCGACRRRSLPLSQFETARSPMSILRASRRTAPLSSHSTSSDRRQFGAHEPCPRTSRQRIAGSL